MTQEERAVRQLSKSQADLDRYYQLNFGHINKIFKLGKNIIILGTIIVMLTLLFIIFSPKSVDTLVVIFGFLSGVLIDLTGAVFIVIYTRTIKSANMNQYGMLETNQAYLGNVLASQIKDESLREETLSELAKKLIEKEKIINYTDSN